MKMTLVTNAREVEGTTVWCWLREGVNTVYQNPTRNKENRYLRIWNGAGDDVVVDDDDDVYREVHGIKPMDELLGDNSMCLKWRSGAWKQS